MPEAGLAEPARDPGDRRSCWGCSRAAGLGLLAEVTDLSFHDARSLQSRLGIPVLAAVPPVVLESDRAHTRARRLRGAVGAALVTSVVLVASLAGNWIVNGPPGPLSRLLGAGAGDRAPAAAAQAPAGGPGAGRRAVARGPACTTSTTGSSAAPSR